MYGRVLALGVAMILSSWVQAFAADGEDSGVKQRAVPEKLDPSKLTTEEKKKQVEAMLSEQRTALKNTSDLQSQARESKDLAQLNCIKERRKVMNALLSASEKASRKMYDAIADGAEDTVNQAFKSVALALNKSNELSKEAAGCAGDDAVFSGKTVITQQFEGELTQVEPSMAVTAFSGPESPPVASNM